MPKYIDADVLLEQMKLRRFFVGRASDPICIIEDAPAADVEPKRRWISVTERKPFAEYGESDAVLTVDSLGEMRVACWDGGNWVLTNGNFIESTMKFPITHWMPLPEPPKEEEA